MCDIEYIWIRGIFATESHCCSLWSRIGFCARIKLNTLKKWEKFIFMKSLKGYPVFFVPIGYISPFLAILIAVLNFAQEKTWIETDLFHKHSYMMYGPYCMAHIKMPHASWVMKHALLKSICRKSDFSAIVWETFQRPKKWN